MMRLALLITLPSFLLLSPKLLYAEHIQMMLGFQQEEISDDISTISRTNMSSFYGEYMRYLAKDIYFSVGLSTTMSIAGFKLLSFGAEGTLRYYILGRGKDVRHQGGDVSFVSHTNWSYFVGLGFTQRFIESTTLGSISRGGLKFENGVHKHWKGNYFYSGHLNYILSGLGSEDEYTSIEAYFGIGYKF